MPGNKRWTAWLAVAALCAGCSFHPRGPDQFAAYPRGLIFKGPYRAVSPEGLLYTVRTEPNEPYADLGFWRQAMKTRMEQAGYRVVADTACTLGGAPGALLKLAAPQGNQDYWYWIAIAASKRKILVVEAAGETKRFLAREADIRKAIEATGW